MPQQGMELFRSFINYFCKETPYDIVFNAVSGDGGIIYEDHALTVEAFPLYHRIPCYGYISGKSQIASSQRRYGAFL